MAKNRIVNTKFWTDTYILDELNPVDKLLFLYLITNPYTDISGVYELPLKVMAVETGIDRDNIEKTILPRFERDGKILYRGGWVAIKNFQKHQTLNPKVQAGMKEGLNKAPEELRLFIEDSLSIEYDRLSHSNSNSNSNSNPKEEGKADALQGRWNEFIDLFKPINPMFSGFYKNRTERLALSQLVDTLGIDEVKNILLVLPQIVTMPYAPKVSKPTELKRDIGKLKIFIDQNRNKLQSKNKVAFQ